MRFFIIAALFSGLLLSACSPTEPLQEEVEEPEEIPGAPSWYDDLEHSYADTVSFYGIAMAAAADSAEAAELSLTEAKENLRFAIDEFVEKVREKAGEESANYNSPEFIIRLRNAVNEMDLSGAESEIKHLEENTIAHHVYSKTVLSRSDALDILSGIIDDSAFISKVREF